VHGDLSEYNLLWYKSKVYFIDVSQSVEYDHPNALVFLRKDLENISKFFAKRLNFTVLSPRQIFDFVTDPNISTDQEEEYLEQAHSVAKTAADRTNSEQVDAAVFVSPSLHIPRTLSEVVHFERDAEDARRGIIHEEVNYYTFVSGLDPAVLLGESNSVCVWVWVWVCLVLFRSRVLSLSLSNNNTASPVLLVFTASSAV
jgi:RIO1 family